MDKIMSGYYTHLFGNPSTFGIDIELYHPDDSKLGDYDFAHWGRFKFWVNGMNLTASTGLGAGDFDYIDWDISDLLEWVATNLNFIRNDDVLPIPDIGPNAAITISQFWRGSEDKEIDLEIREQVFEWWRRHSIQAASCGGIFPDIVFSRFADDIEISWDSRRAFLYSDRSFVEASGIAILPLDEVCEVLSSFQRETMDAILKEISITKEPEGEVE